MNCTVLSRSISLEKQKLNATFCLERIFILYYYTEKVWVNCLFKFFSDLEYLTQKYFIIFIHN